MNEISNYQFMDNDFYKDVKEVLDSARKKVYRNIQNEMLLAYWEIGKMIVEKQGGEARAKYGDGLIKELSSQLIKDFGKGFTISNLKNMRLFYLKFQKSHALRGQLTWTHYRILLIVFGIIGKTDISRKKNIGKTDYFTYNNIGKT